MTRFEYLSVLISIVIALGMSEVTVSWGRLIQHRNQVRFSWLHAFWSAFIMLLMIQFWWGFWNFRTVEDWSLFALIGVVLEATTLVICALLLTPGRSLSGSIDLESLYFEHSRPFFLFGAFVLIQFSLIDTLVVGIPIFHMENLIRFLATAVVILLAWSSNSHLHSALAIVCVLLLAVFLINTIMF